MEAIFGLVGMLLGPGISWFQSYWISKQETDKRARAFQSKPKLEWAQHL